MLVLLKQRITPIRFLSRHFGDHILNNFHQNTISKFIMWFLIQHNFVYNIYVVFSKYH